MKNNEDPRGFISEGHLDSLGICIFLAFYKKFCMECPYLILDDIITSIDSQHRYRIGNLILSEFKDKQVIITTHDEYWFETLIKLQKSNNLFEKFENIKITSWCKNNGLRIEPYKTKWDKICEKIENGDKTGAGNEGRHFLEHVCKQICFNFDIRTLPITKNGRYSLNDLFDSSRKFFKDKIKDENYKMTIEEIFKRIAELSELYNLLSHDNPINSEISIKEIKLFCESIKELEKQITCSNCNSYLKFDREEKTIKCKKHNCDKKTTYKVK